MTIVIDAGTYVSAAERLGDINLDLAAAYDRFVTELAGCGGIAGSDDPAADFAAAYDDAAGAAVWAYMDVVAASGTLSQLVEISARNHAAADLGSMILPGGFMYEPDVPLPEGLPAKVWQSTPPSLEGGDGAGPDWWHWVADKVGHLYPDADCDELRELGRRWTEEALTLDIRGLDCRLVAEVVALQCSWEVDDAVASCIELGDQLDTLAGSFRELGKMCTAYADQVEWVRDEITGIAKEFLWWTLGTQLVTHAAAFLTVGAAEVPGQAVQAARVAIAAKKIRDVLAGLAMWSVTKLGPLNMVGREAAGVSVVAQRLARPSVVISRTVGHGGHRAPDVVRVVPGFSFGSGARNGRNVRNFVGPANAVVRGASEGRVFVTDSLGRVLLDITAGRTKLAIPGHGWVRGRAGKRTPTSQELAWIESLWKGVG